MRRRLYKTVNDHQWAYLEFGERTAPAIFIVHGMVNDADIFLPLNHELAYYFRVIIPDLPGYGKTTRISAGNTYQNIAREYAAFVKTFNLAEANFLGVSAGGGILLELALRNPELINKYVVNSPFLKAEILAKNPVEKAEVFLINQPTPLLQAIRRPLTIKGLLDFAEKVTPEKIRQTIKKEEKDAAEILLTLDIRGNQELLQSFMGADLGPRARLLRKKPLFLTGDRDQAIPPDITTALARKLGAPLVVLTGENHNVTADRPRLFAEIVADFILHDKQTCDATCHWG